MGRRKRKRQLMTRLTDDSDVTDMISNPVETPEPVRKTRTPIGFTAVVDLQITTPTDLRYNEKTTHLIYAPSKVELSHLLAVDHVTHIHGIFKGKALEHKKKSVVHF